jgi:hypothetical protein
MKKTLALLLAAVMLFAFAACGGHKDLATDVLPVCLASEPNNIDPALNSSVDGATMVSHLFAGLAKWAKDETGKLVIVPECVEELTEGVLNDNDMAEIFGLDILVILANTYCKTLAAVLAFKNQRLSHLVTTCIKVNGMVTLGAYYLAHKRFV